MNHEEKILELLEHLNRAQAETQEKIAGMDERLTETQGKIAGIDERLTETQEKIAGIDERLTETQEKIAGMDERLTETQEKIAGMDERLTETQTAAVRAAVLLEGDVQPKLQLLYDGHQSIMERLEALAPRNRVEALEEEMSFMKTVVKALSQEVAELKKAQ